MSSNGSLPFKRLSQSKMQSRPEKGLCFNCDEKFSAGHRCKTGPQLLLLSYEAEDPLLSQAPTISDEVLADELQC